VQWLQQWNDVLFLHFAAPRDELERLLPARLQIDAYAGWAWVSYVFFQLKLRPAWVPFVPPFSSLLELNVRTYVRYRGQPGIYFLSMHSDNRWAIRAARLLTPLDYQPARMSYQAEAGGWRRAECQATTPLARREYSHGLSANRLAARFRIRGAPAPAIPGSLDAWLLERYRLFVGRGDGALSTADVEHFPWQVSPVDAFVADNSIADPLGLSFSPAQDAAHFSRGLSARFNRFCPVADCPRTRYFAIRPPGHAAAPHGGR
jgi:uncharacterized protein